MMSLEPIFIGSYDKGLFKDKKPYLGADNAFSDLQNAYVWRESVKKRECLELVGRLRRTLIDQSLGLSQVSPWTIEILSSIGIRGLITAITNSNPGQVTSSLHNLVNGNRVIFFNVGGMTQLNGNTFTVTVVDPNNFTIGVDTTTFGAYTSGGYWVNATEPNAQIQPGTVLITMGAITFTDIAPTLTSPNGTLISNTVGNSGTINYATGVIVLTHTAGIGVATTISFSYFPSLPVMGIEMRELSGINQEQTVFFDTKYAYIFSAGGFQEFIQVPPNIWQGTDSDFFYSVNWQGSGPNIRTFFVTNFNNNPTSPDPIRYTITGGAWIDFAPIIADNPPSAGQSKLFQARILIPYYGRLIAFNTWEGLTATGQANAINFFTRARFSALGDPTAVDAWRTDIFGKGGFVDAPTSEAIVSAIFFKNTLIVGFERSTWQLRYVGEYGIPFIWERISSDFGTESQFSTVLFDKGVLSIGDKAIIQSNGLTCQRIDIDIPDTVFGFKNANQGTQRIQGIRDFRRELVFWSYVESTDEQNNQTFPNRVLVYNYKNDTWAIFRDNVTAFGTLQPNTAISWDSLDIFWDDMDTTWDDPDEQTSFPYIVAGNQQGFIHRYGYKTPDDGSLSITGVDLTTSPIKLNIVNHNLEDGEIIFLQNLAFVDSITNLPLATSLNGFTYQVFFIDNNTIGILKWDGTNYVNNFSFTPIPTAVYIGGGTAALDPVLFVQTKDFNPYQAKGMQLKMSYIDFLTDATPSALMTIQLWLNSSMSVQGNLLVGNQEVETFLPSPYYVPNSEYAWHRFYATLAGQYIRIVMTYDDVLMNNLDTRNQSWRLNAMNLWCKRAGKIVF